MFPFVVVLFNYRDDFIAPYNRYPEITALVSVIQIAQRIGYDESERRITILGPKGLCVEEEKRIAL